MFNSQTPRKSTRHKSGRRVDLLENAIFYVPLIIVKAVFTVLIIPRLYGRLIFIFPEHYYCNLFRSRLRNVGFNWLGVYFRILSLSYIYLLAFHVEKTNLSKRKAGSQAVSLFFLQK